MDFGREILDVTINKGEEKMQKREKDDMTIIKKIHELDPKNPNRYDDIFTTLKTNKAKTKRKEFRRSE